jgi:predicted AlkP superfamily pyrophosphatase or phosphodiesterase
MTSLRLLLAACCFSLIATESPAGWPPRVLIIGIDGLRPDALEQAETPHLDRLIADGIYFEGTDIREPEGTDDADTISGPGWSNLLCGVWPDKHGVLDNEFTAPHYDQYPHMFARLKEVRPDAVTATFSTWAPILDQITSHADTGVNISEEVKDYPAWDARAADACVGYLAEHVPDLLVFYQGQVDETGHAHGFHPNVTQYIAAIEQVDANVGRVLSAIDALPDESRGDWLVIVCTDHGGSGTNHGGGRDNPDVRKTFLIVSGAAAERGSSEEPTWQVDVAATALTHLGVLLSPEWELDGQPRGLRDASQLPVQP